MASKGTTLPARMIQTKEQRRNQIIRWFNNDQYTEAITGILQQTAIKETANSLHKHLELREQLFNQVCKVTRKIDELAEEIAITEEYRILQQYTVSHNRNPISSSSDGTRNDSPTQPTTPEPLQSNNEGDIPNDIRHQPIPYRQSPIIIPNTPTPTNTQTGN